jgi:ribosomal protein S18 acetylase RimI-like enzyme
VSRSFLIRVFEYPKDYPGVLRLWETAGPGLHVGRSDTPAEIEKKLQRDPDLFLVAESEGHIVGAVIGGFDGRRGMVYHLGVLPELQRNGIGRALMESVEDLLRQKGCLKAYLVAVRENESAASFYETCGWQEGTDLRLYLKELD